MSKDTDYEAARRRARKLLGVHAELRINKDAPVWQYHIGVMSKGAFVPFGVGGTWDEAFDDAGAQASDEDEEETT